MEPSKLVDELRRAIERRDADQVARVLHPSAELHLYSAQDAIVGRENAHAWYRQVFESRIVFDGWAEPETTNDGSVLLRGRVRWYDDGVLRDRPGQWRVTFRDGLIAAIAADARADTDPAVRAPHRAVTDGPSAKSQPPAKPSEQPAIPG